MNDTDVIGRPLMRRPYGALPLHPSDKRRCRAAPAWRTKSQQDTSRPPLPFVATTHVDQAAFIVMNAKNIVLGLSLAVLGAGVVLMCVAQHEVNELSFQIGLMLAPFN